MTKGLLIESQYLPCIDYFKLIKENDVIILDNNESFIKQSYRNRCKVLLTNKIETLSIPVLKASKGATIKSIEIDYNQRWLKSHLRGIQSAYGKSPFFEHYFPDISSVIESKPKFLYDMNYTLLETCLKHLGLKQQIIESNSVNYNPKEYVLSNNKDIVHPKSNNLNGNYKSYYQVFGSEFVSNLSIIDLLFCEGPSSRLFL